METRPIFVLLAFLAAATAPAAEVYTWTDGNGVVHYSDRATPGADIIELPEATNSRPVRPAPPARQSSNRNDDAAAQQPFSYETLEVASPAAEETLWNIGGTLGVRLSLSPTLQPGHQLRVYFDGQPREVIGTSFSLVEVYRGEHNLQAEVVDATGTLMIRSTPIRFYVQQSTVNN